MAAPDAMAQTHRLLLPGIFWRDHYDRCEEHPGKRLVIYDEGSNRVRVELDAVALDDLHSDARYYANGVDFAGEKEAYRSLINSARATVRAIKRQMGKD